MNQHKKSTFLLTFNSKKDLSNAQKGVDHAFKNDTNINAHRLVGTCTFIIRTTLEQRSLFNHLKKNYKILNQGTFLLAPIRKPALHNKPKTKQDLHKMGIETAN